jgi:two-component system NtrC family sensor kinase
MLTTLSTRTFLLAAAVTLIGMGLLAWVLVRMHTVDLEKEAMRGASQLSDTLRRSTRYSMLNNRKEDVYEIVDAVGAQPGIEHIRIYNKGGKITFSTAPNERGVAVDMDAEACTYCHAGDSEHTSPTVESERPHVFKGEEGHRVLSLTMPIYNEAGCASAMCHAPPDEKSVLGVIEIQTSLARIDQVVQSRKQRFLFLTYFLMLLIASACGVFIWRFVHVPVKALIQGTRHFAKGNLDYRISVRSKTEIGQLAKAFNHMARDLSKAQMDLTDWAQTLEQRVEEKTQTLKQAQAKLLQNEKMASLGSLSAVVAHEINNPLSGVLIYTKLVRKMISNDTDPKQKESIAEYLEAMESETARCGKIVSNLLAFSRQSVTAVEETDINQLLKKILFLIDHKLKLQGIVLIKAFCADTPNVNCEPDQIQQAFLAVLINAIESMSDGGKLTVETHILTEGSPEERWIEVSISDTGTGIAEDVLPLLFEPFFTTKENKKGVGLGLSVVYGIIKRHHGRVDVKSEPGSGTTILMALPEKAEIEQDILDAESENPILRSMAEAQEK